MGLGPPVIELYRQLKLHGALDGITSVMELGSQDFWCPQQNLVRALFAAFGRPEPDPDLLATANASQKPARVLYEGLGIAYNCVDVDGRTGTLVAGSQFRRGAERSLEQVWTGDQPRNFRAHHEPVQRVQDDARLHPSGRRHDPCRPLHGAPRTRVLQLSAEFLRGVGTLQFLRNTRSLGRSGLAARKLHSVGSDPS